MHTWLQFQSTGMSIVRGVRFLPSSFSVQQMRATSTKAMTFLAGVDPSAETAAERCTRSGIVGKQDQGHDSFCWDGTNCGEGYRREHNVGTTCVDPMVDSSKECNLERRYVWFAWVNRWRLLTKCANYAGKLSGDHEQGHDSMCWGGVNGEDCRQLMRHVKEKCCLTKGCAIQSNLDLSGAIFVSLTEGCVNASHACLCRC